MLFWERTLRDRFFISHENKDFSVILFCHGVEAYLMLYELSFILGAPHKLYNAFFFISLHLRLSNTQVIAFDSRIYSYIGIRRILLTSTATL